MILAIDVYNDANDQLNEEENGQFSYELFNRLSWRAQTRLMDWLSGDVASSQPPEPFLTSKNKDWLAPFIVEWKAQVKDGVLTLPEGFYRLHNWEIIGTSTQQDCETNEEITDRKANIPGETIDGNAFASRGGSYIDELKPSISTIPIAKIVNNQMVFNPSDPGSIVVEYLRYPAKAQIKTIPDPVYNDLVADPNSINFEWSPFASDILVWFIVDQFVNRTSNNSGKQMNMATQKTVRG